MSAAQVWLESKYLAQPKIFHGGAIPITAESSSSGWTALLSIVVSIFGIVIVFVVIGVFLYLMARNRVDEIQEKWPDYRCKINIMPIAGWVGPPGTSTTQNFQDCMEDFVGGYISRKFAPLFSIFDRIFSALTFLRSSVQQVRKAIYSIRTTLASLTNEIFKRIKNLYYRLFTIMKRILALISYLVLAFRNSFYVMKYSYWIFKAFWGPIGWLIDKLNALESVVNAMRSPVDAVSSFFCFHPLQQIYSSTCGIRGWQETSMERLYPSCLVNPSQPTDVIGRWDFWNGSGKWYQVGGGVGGCWLMTAEHTVYDPYLGIWVHANKYTRNVLLDGTRTQVCPWTRTGFLEGQPGCWTTDYWGPTTFEFETEYWTKIVTEVQALGTPLQGADLSWAYMKWDYVSMLMNDWEVKMNNGTWKALERVKKGDVLWDDNAVYGRACTLASTYRWLDRGMTIGTWVKDGLGWANVSVWGETLVDKTGLCYQLATLQESFIVRDPVSLIEYEVRDTSGWLFPSIEEWRETTLLADLNNSKCPCSCPPCS